MNLHTRIQSAISRRNRGDRRGSIVVLGTGLLVASFAMTAFAIDIGLITLTKNQLQTAADAASLSAVLQLGTGESNGVPAAMEVAQEMALANAVGHGDVVDGSAISAGVWNEETHSFQATANSPNAIRVVLQRSHARGNPLQLLFAPVIGHEWAEVAATSIAYKPQNGAQFRFLLDEEIIDSDEEAIEDLADSMGEDPEDIIWDHDDDGFLDLPAGTSLELPTGQVGDEAMFDVASYEGAFPFQSSSLFTTLDFLAEGTALESELGTQAMQDVEWDGDDAPHPDFEGKKVLDPVPGVDPVNNHSDILSLPDPDTIYVSPVFKSDVSMQETDPDKYGSPTANLQGERRGLLAYKIIAARSHPDGGSYLPLITIQIVDPNSIELEEAYMGSSSGSSGSGTATLVY